MATLMSHFQLLRMRESVVLAIISIRDIRIIYGSCFFCNVLTVFRCAVDSGSVL